MIVAKLKGGLGNQMFQYAAATSLAIEHNTDHYFDFSYTAHPKRGGILINKLSNVKLPHLTEHQLPEIEDDFVYQTIPNNCYINGFWQSEKYFAKNADVIREHLDFDNDVKSYVAEKYPVLNQHTVSMHVRRGDYVTKHTEFPPRDVDYYNTAYDIINDTSIAVIVVSDDIAWCKDNLKFGNCVYIEDESDLIDLYIMSQCLHNVIANSTYSWWGAWLNSNPDKKVIAPKQWFGPNKPLNESDIIPDSWIII